MPFDQKALLIVQGGQLAAWSRFSCVPNCAQTTLVSAQAAQEHVCAGGQGWQLAGIFLVHSIACGCCARW
jgi:hypothetical protein